jgi:outer membrane protein
MKNTFKHSLTAPKLVLLAASLVAVSAAQAQTKPTQSPFSVFGGITHISPDVTSGNLSAPSLPGTRADVGDATSLTGGFAYEVNADLRVAFAILAVPFKHDITGDGAIAGVGKIGSVKQLPPTIFAQYRFLGANSKFRPYAGLGLTYAYFFDSEGTGTLTGLTNPGGAATTLKVKSKFGFTPQLGLTYHDHLIYGAKHVDKA